MLIKLNSMRMKRVKPQVISTEMDWLKASNKCIALQLKSNPSAKTNR